MPQKDFTQINLFDAFINQLQSNECTEDLKIVLYGHIDSKIECLDPTFKIPGNVKSAKVGEIIERDPNLIYLAVGDLQYKDVDSTDLVPYSIAKAVDTLGTIVKGDRFVGRLKMNVYIYAGKYQEVAILNFIQTVYQFDIKFITCHEEYQLHLPFKPMNIQILPSEKKIFMIGVAQAVARFLGQLPSNYLTPVNFANLVQSIFKDCSDVQMSILTGEQCKELGMEVYYSVTQGSSYPGRFVTLKYFNRGENVHDIALVGKGVTFDTGGISLKKATNMKAQKSDMMGAAIGMTAFLLAVKFKLKVNITCTLPMVDNAIGGSATKPGDVFLSLNKISVDIGSTDAEGRLILADSMVYAQTMYDNLKPKYLVDLATLTGAVKVALGGNCCGFMTNDKYLKTKIEESTRVTNEFLHYLPLSKIFSKSMTSTVADLSNHSNGKFRCGSLLAGIFLHKFVEKGVKHAHFDIAGIARTTITANGPELKLSGRPLHTLYSLIENLNYTTNDE